MLALKRTAATTLMFVSKCPRNLSQQTKTKLGNFLVGQAAGNERIFAEIFEKDDEFQSFMTNSEVVLHKITPCAPWQGGFYERLIKDIKRALFKALGRKVLDEDSLNTALVEIEGCLNSCPLTYQDADLDDLAPIRPIDFLQKHLCISYKTSVRVTEDSDLDFHTPAEVVQLRTRIEAEEALKTSSQIVDKFWKVWSDAYLTSLREYHKHKLDQGRSTTLQPEVGQVVLLQDAMLPRNKWKLAKIIKLERSTDGEVREVQIKQSNGKITKRPVNLPIPLEIEEENGYASEVQEPLTERDQSESLETAKHVSTEENTNNANKDSLRPSRTRKYPYSDDYEVYTVNMVEQNVAKSVPTFRMDAKQAASTLLKQLNAKTRSLFE
ncbi:hypothetical protein OESDEN_12707 [Oesophagostomum dentatum]|uniref:DUF5641 domain-containing protein n=1 Tax=Oesophagostomum dentatum TaxID=61180 RepID=A0A0B1SUF0_OESDE|nr:hypothetical protein OESDEN_12707 [Oesophagostomum dentatum]